MSLSFGELAKNSFCDFFHLPEDYYLRIRMYDDPKLKRQEAVKTRQTYAAMCSMVNGAVFSVPSHGGTLVICAWAARRLFVANRKLKAIKAELTLRGIELRPFLNRDWMIPVAVAVTGAAIGLGVDFGLGAFVPIGHVGEVTSLDGAHAAVLPTPSGATAAVAAHHVVQNGSSLVDTSSVAPFSGTQELHAVAAHAGTAAHEGARGFAEQLQHFFNPGHGTVEGMMAQSGDQGLAGAVGFVEGAHAAQAIEHSLAVLTGSQSLQWMSEKLDFESLRPRVSKQLACRRLPWSTGVLCDRCEIPIMHGKFYHCCDCGYEDEFDLCTLCYKENPHCLSDEHQLKPLQLAVPGDTYHPEKSSLVLKKIAGPSTLSCSSCAEKITQGWYYDCWECRRHEKPAPWTICLLCYRRGCTCKEDDTHRLYAFPRMIFAKFQAETPYQRKISPETGRAACADCGTIVEKGAYYHCSKCDGGNYDLCSMCYQTGGHCRRSDHVLTKYYAWKYKRNIDPSVKRSWKCSNPDCMDPARKNEFFFSCLEKTCQAKQFGLCGPCYFTDLCCPIQEHNMFKCIFR